MPQVVPEEMANTSWAYIHHPLVLALVPGLEKISSTSEESRSLPKAVAAVTQKGCDSESIGRAGTGKAGGGEREDGEMQAEGCQLH